MSSVVESAMWNWLNTGPSCSPPSATQAATKAEPCRGQKREEESELHERPLPQDRCAQSGDDGQDPDRHPKGAPEPRWQLLPHDPARGPEETQVVLIQVGRRQERGKQADGNCPARRQTQPVHGDQRGTG